jgi:Flagellar biosynthesis protein, FliO
VEFINQYMNVIIAALVILAVLLIILMVWRTFAGRVRGRRGQRLGISEYQELDKMRRLVLIRRDNVEHLVLIGGPQDVVIEQSITSSGLASFASEEPRTIPMRPAPRAPGYGDRKPPALRPVEREEPAIATRNRDLDRP